MVSANRPAWLAAAIVLLALPAAADGMVTDADMLALSVKHCTACHGKNPSHQSVREAPKNIGLETIAELKRHAKAILEQTVKTKAMPLGNQTEMTDAERAMVGRWIRAQP